MYGCKVKQCCPLRPWMGLCHAHYIQVRWGRSTLAGGGLAHWARYAYNGGNYRKREG